jgi:ribosome recycling factor
MSSEVIDMLLDDAGSRMAKSVESAQHEFATVRTGRASPALLDRIVVDYYGAPTPLKQLATVSAPEARLITVHPYDKSAIAATEKAINESDLGLNPSNDGAVIRLMVPEPTQERRSELVKVVRGLAEEGRIAVRNIRREVMGELREHKTNGEVSSDDEHRGETALQKLTDSRVAEIDDLLKAKEAEILEI